MTDAAERFDYARMEAVQVFMDRVAEGSDPNTAWEDLCVLFGRSRAPWTSVVFSDEGIGRVGVRESIIAELENERDVARKQRDELQADLSELRGSIELIDVRLDALQRD